MHHGHVGKHRSQQNHTTEEGEAERGLHETPLALGYSLSLGMALLQWEEDSWETGTT